MSFSEGNTLSLSHITAVVYELQNKVKALETFCFGEGGGKHARSSSFSSVSAAPTFLSTNVSSSPAMLSSSTSSYLPSSPSRLLSPNGVSDLEKTSLFVSLESPSLAPPVSSFSFTSIVSPYQNLRASTSAPPSPSAFFSASPTFAATAVTNTSTTASSSFGSSASLVFPHRSASHFGSVVDSSLHLSSHARSHPPLSSRAHTSSHTNSSSTNAAASSSRVSSLTISTAATLSSSPSFTSNSSLFSSGDISFDHPLILPASISPNESISPSAHNSAHTSSSYTTPLTSSTSIATSAFTTSSSDAFSSSSSSSSSSSNVLDAHIHGSASVRPSRSSSPSSPRFSIRPLSPSSSSMSTMSENSLASPTHTRSPASDPMFMAMSAELRNEDYTAIPELLEEENKEIAEHRKKYITEMLEKFPRHLLGFPPSGSQWIERFVFAISQHSSELLLDFTRDFHRAATTRARIILEEINVPAHKKTIPPITSTYGVAGGTKFVDNNIMFKFANDPKVGHNHLYGGAEPDPERAAKAAANDLKGANAYVSSWQCIRMPMIVLPQIVMDFVGFRLIALPWIDMRGHELVAGSGDAGGAVVDRDDITRAAMKYAARKLHLARHLVRDTWLYSAGDIEVHKAPDGKRIVLDLSRTLPPEAPDATPHLPRVQSSIFFRLHRASFMHHLKDLKDPKFPPLSADALSLWGVNEGKEHDKNAILATRYLVDTRCREIVKELLNKNYSWTRLGPIIQEGGISLRHLGLLRSLCYQQLILSSPSSSSCHSRKTLSIHSLAAVKECTPDEQKLKHLSEQLLMCMVARSGKNLLRQELREAVVSKNVKQAIVTFLNTCLRSNSQINTSRYDAFWGVKLPRDIIGRYGKKALLAEEENMLSEMCKNFLPSLIFYMCNTSGILVNHLLVDWTQIQHPHFIFTGEMVQDLLVRSKTVDTFERLLIDDLITHACESHTKAEFLYHLALILRKKIPPENVFLINTLELLHPPVCFDKCYNFFVENFQRLCNTSSFSTASSLSTSSSAASSCSTASAVSSSTASSTAAAASASSSTTTTTTTATTSRRSFSLFSPASPPLSSPPPPPSRSVSSLYYRASSLPSYMYNANNNSNNTNSNVSPPLPPVLSPSPSLLLSSSSPPRPSVLAPPPPPPLSLLSSALSSLRESNHFRCLILLALSLHFMGYTCSVLNTLLPLLHRLSHVAFALYDALPQCASFVERKQVFTSALQKVCLQETCDHSHELLAKCLLESNADARSAIAETGDTLLHVCVLRQHLGVAQLLLAGKADVNMVDYYGRSVSSLLQATSLPTPVRSSASASASCPSSPKQQQQQHSRVSASLLASIVPHPRVSSSSPASGSPPPLHPYLRSSNNGNNSTVSSAVITPMNLMSAYEEIGVYRLRVHSICGAIQSLSGMYLEFGFRKLRTTKIKIEKKEMKNIVNLSTREIVERENGECVLPVQYEYCFNEWTKQREMLICLKQSGVVLSKLGALPAKSVGMIGYVTIPLPNTPFSTIHVPFVMEKTGASLSLSADLTVCVNSSRSIL